MTTATALKLNIDGMHCDACIRRVTQALGRVPGVHVRDVKVGEASLSYDPLQSSANTIADAVNAIGFHASADQARG